MTEDVRHSKFKAGLIVHVLPIVVTKALLIEVAKQMERLDTNVSTANAALQETPEVLKAVGVDASIDIFNGMIDNLVSILISQSLIREKSVGIESGISLDMLLYSD